MPSTVGPCVTPAGRAAACATVASAKAKKTASERSVLNMAFGKRES